jgi:hypothetical protein
VSFPLASDHLSRVINVHWNTGSHLWLWYFLECSFSARVRTGTIITAGASTPDFFQKYQIRSVDFTTSTAPPRPAAPAWPGSVGDWSAYSGTTSTAGWPGDVDVGPKPSGFNGPFLTNATGGAYNLTVDTRYQNATTGISQPGPSASFDFSSVSVTLPGFVAGGSDLTFAPYSLARAPSWDSGSNSEVAGIMILVADRAIGS